MKNKLIKKMLLFTFCWLLISCSQQAKTPTMQQDEVIVKAPTYEYVETSTEKSTELPSERATNDMLVNLECIGTFEDFAYTQPEDDETSSPVGYSSPWQVVENLPQPSIDSMWTNEWVSIARVIEGQTEIWIRRMYAQDDNFHNYEILIYNLNTKIWKSLSAHVEGTDIFVRDLYITSDGTIWGVNYWNNFVDHTMKSTPVLSKYNEEMEQFEFVPGVPQVFITDGTSYEHRYQKGNVLLDRNNIFWILIQQDGLYTFNPENLEIKKVAELKQYRVKDFKVAKGGGIYLYQDLEIYGGKLTIGELVYFDPETGEMTPIELPSKPWPGFTSSIFVDNSGRLWLNSLGWREPGGNWHQLHPDFEVFFDPEDPKNHLTPTPYLESSNGMIWFLRLPGTFRTYPGTAWFIPETGEGCWFSNNASPFIEDAQQNLWLVSDGKLYKNALNP